MQSSTGSGSLQSVLEGPQEIDEALAEMANAKSASAKTFIFQLASKIFTREDLEDKWWIGNRLPVFKYYFGVAAFAALLMNFI